MWFYLKLFLLTNVNFVRCKLGSVRQLECINQSDNSIESSVDELWIWRTLKKIFGVNRDRPLIPFGVNVFYPLGDLANRFTMQRKYCALRHTTHHQQYKQTLWPHLHATVSHQDAKHYNKHYECEVCGNNLTTLNINSTCITTSTNITRT